MVVQVSVAEAGFTLAEGVAVFWLTLVEVALEQPVMVFVTVTEYSPDQLTSAVPAAPSWATMPDGSPPDGPANT